MDNLRTVEILRAGVFYNSDFEDIEKGDIFRLFEPGGNPVIGHKHITEFIATSNAYLNENKIWEVEMDEVEYEGSREIGIYDDGTII